MCFAAIAARESSCLGPGAFPRGCWHSRGPLRRPDGKQAGEAIIRAGGKEAAGYVKRGTLKSHQQSCSGESRSEGTPETDCGCSTRPTGDLGASPGARQHLMSVTSDGSLVFCLLGQPGRGAGCCSFCHAARWLDASISSGVCPADIPVCPSLSITKVAGKNACGQSVMCPRGAEPAPAGGVYSVGT